MGMDVYGNRPTTETGEYFRRNVWGWRPLSIYVEEMHPELYSACEHWHTNDGDGLDAETARELAAALRADVANGQAKSYVEIRDRGLKSLPNEECFLCAGTGVRRDAVGYQAGQPERVIPKDAKGENDVGPHPRAGEKGWCNGCEGRGFSRPAEVRYGLEENDLLEFAAFCEASGGFKIW